ncbi:LysR family transcriptional regulator [Neiella marina]|uniref:LysR family transcriptional regulator n=1 Tax=Neiella marina TaxID=508461 RepID=A0A8J2U5F8_9GAMM|nr:LysR substrate-binding domain-containing protein [Neiella marina]GGA79323.1 LysR family transcriptional regulator [Neiella marina]
MHDLSIRQLRVFVTAAQTGSLGDVSQQLNMTRSAASQALKSLEQQLGAALFARSNQRLQLNGHGHALLPLANELLQCEHTIWDLFQPQSSQGKLRLGASLTIGNFVVPSLLAQLSKHHQLPEVTLANSSQLQQALKNYQLDVALIESDVIDSALTRQPWLTDEMILIAGPQHPLAGQQIEWHQLEAQQWILREPFSGSREHFEHHIAPHISDMELVLELNNLAAIIGSVGQHVGLSLASKLACQQALTSGQVAQIHLPSPLIRQFYVVYPKSNQTLSLVTNFLQQVDQFQFNEPS